MSDSSSSVNAGQSSYRNYEEEARKLVLAILQQALLAYQREVARTVLMEWPTGENFTVEVAKEAIDTLVKARDGNESRSGLQNISFIELEGWRVLEILH